jgi:hypothetical protein
MAEKTTEMERLIKRMERLNIEDLEKVKEAAIKRAKQKKRDLEEKRKLKLGQLVIKYQKELLEASISEDFKKALKGALNV